MDKPEINVEVSPHQKNIDYRVNESYLKALKAKIEKVAEEAAIKHSDDVHNKMVVVKFLIHPAGEMSNLRIVSSSKKYDLDQVALKSLHSACPFNELLSAHKDPTAEPREVWFEATFRWL